jgi:hypothetical protein
MVKLFALAVQIVVDTPAQFVGVPAIRRVRSRRE